MKEQDPTQGDIIRDKKAASIPLNAEEIGVVIDDLEDKQREREKIEESAQFKNKKIH